MKTLPLFLLVLPLFSILEAKERPVIVDEEFIEIDRDKDGQISRIEYREEQVEYLMKRYDRNSDGKISADEMKKQNTVKTGSAKGAGHLKAKDLDQNKDGKISRKELERVVIKQKKTDWYFDTIDADKNDHITRYERPQDRPMVGGMKITF